MLYIFIVELIWFIKKTNFETHPLDTESYLMPIKSGDRFEAILASCYNGAYGQILQFFYYEGQWGIFCLLTNFVEISSEFV